MKSCDRCKRDVGETEDLYSVLEDSIRRPRRSVSVCNECYLADEQERPAARIAKLEHACRVAIELLRGENYRENLVAALRDAGFEVE